MRTHAHPEHQEQCKVAPEFVALKSQLRSPLALLKLSGSVNIQTFITDTKGKLNLLNSIPIYCGMHNMRIGLS
jgi:hypothetical protein